MATSSEVGNQHGFLCPSCKSGDELWIDASVNVRARLSEDGCDYDGGDVEWENSNYAGCSCGWEGTVGQFEEAEKEPEDVAS